MTWILDLYFICVTVCTVFLSCLGKMCVWGGDTRINLKRVNMTTEENNLQKCITFAFLSFFSCPLLNYVVLSHGNVWSIVMHIHLAEENPLGKLQCTVRYILSFIPPAFLRYPHIPCSWVVIHICFNVWRQLEISFVQLSKNRTSPGLGCLPSSDTNLWTSLWSNE